MGLGSVLLSTWFVVTGESGATYNMLRAVEAPEDRQASLNFGLYRGVDTFDTNAPLHIPFKEHPVIEPFVTKSTKDSIIYEGKGFRYEFFADRVEWEEAGGRVKITARPLGDVCSFHIPEQKGFPHPFAFRSNFAKAEGFIDGDPVEGLYQMDCIYSRPELTLRDTRFVDSFEHHWFNWLVEYEDGSLEGGHAWNGRPKADFTAAHHYVDGQSTARRDANLQISRTERGSIDKIVLDLGDDLHIEFAQQGTFDWPSHTYGVVSSISRDKKVVRSWNYMESYPLNWSDVEDYQVSHKNLYGKHPSLQKMLDGAYIKDDYIVFK
ncbi:hypothetical protein AB4Y80_15025 [Specibacter sp. RAF43]